MKFDPLDNVKKNQSKKCPMRNMKNIENHLPEVIL